jgi:DNA-binding FadR family transcriptional regulator
MVADVLRRRILAGSLRDGDLLPKQEELIAEFQVSKPSVREAFRILETEGLITVRRGNVGGSVVHVPKAETVAYMLALVLQSRDVSLVDTGSALRELEPVAASLCAAREDRNEAVLPRLRAEHARLEEALRTGDELEAIQASRAFHESLVDRCGNETMKVVLGALETLWSAHEQRWAEEATQAGEFPEPGSRTRALDEHAAILDLIERGDVAAVAHAARQHLEGSQQYPLTPDAQRRVEASSLRVMPPT